ncbi:hypothetical protein FH972_025799 [Carpinus fangiana]|uniref:Amino acid permease/ SLC12A domain-containing protein n=1 Tax=Carpinus fangiana TaxID=176857 RepID=A0A5N6L256_9ROSI|nr:hypothetical protein FH972_025799 [Carpinus fangiana]
MEMNRMYGSKESTASHEVVAVSLDRDTLALARAGKKAVLKRRFGLTSMIGFACSIMITWEGMIVNMGLALENGGPAGLLYGALITWLGTLCVFITMGELSSMLPTAGGQYHWASILAPGPSKQVLSYITGWITVAAWVAAPTAAAYLTATLMQELISLNIPAYQPQGWHGTLIMWAVLVLAVVLNTLLGPLLPVMELLFLSLHVLGFFAVLIPLVNLAPHGNSHDIWTTFNDGGNWGSKGLAFFLGLQGNAAALLETTLTRSKQMAEEVKSADSNVAKSMVLAVVINGATGFAMLVAFMYSAGPIDELLKSESQYPFIDIIANGTGSNGAAAVLVSIIIVMNFCATVSAISSGSRMIWSFSRDQGLPFWKYLRRVGRKNSIPTLAVIVVVTCAALLGLIQIGSSTAFNDVISLVLEGFFASYLCVLLPLLYHRIKGNIADPEVDGNEIFFVDESSTPNKPFMWGPWRVKGIFGILNNAIACIYLIVVGFFSFWPPGKGPTAESMNYSSLVLGAVAIGSFVYYLVWARKTYSGPIVEVEAQRLRQG